MVDMVFSGSQLGCWPGDSPRHSMDSLQDAVDGLQDTINLSKMHDMVSYIMGTFF